MTITFNAPEGQKTGIIIRWIHKLWLVKLADGRTCYVMPIQIVEPMWLV